MTRENKTKYIILGLLSHEPQTGYDIRQHAQQSIGNFWSEISYGQIYPTLEAMEKEGLVTKETHIEDGRRLRKVHSITKKGLSELQRWLEAPSEPEVYKFDLLLKIYFGAQTSIEHNKANVQAFKQRNEQLLELYSAYERSLNAVLQENVDHQFMLLTLHFGQHLVKAELKWADEALKTFDSIVKTQKAAVVRRTASRK